MWLLTFVCSGWCYTKIEDPPPIITSANELCRLLQLQHMLFRRVDSTSASMTTAVPIHLQLQVLLTYPHPAPFFPEVPLCIPMADCQSNLSANHFGPHKTHLIEAPNGSHTDNSSSPGIAGPWSLLLPTSHPPVRNPGPHALSQVPSSAPDCPLLHPRRPRRPHGATGPDWRSPSR